MIETNLLIEQCPLCEEGVLIKEDDGMRVIEYCDKCGTLMQSLPTIEENMRRNK
ncbi:MAG: hypothetical protein ACXW2E_02000 [Nitrososphaeraceae archaeon]